MKYLYRALLASFIILSSTTLAYAQTVVLAPISTNTTWTAANGPFLIGIPVTIQSGATLTIEPGTIVKFTEQSAGLEIETGATLSAQGTAGQPIYFTSYSDDVGGDTNGDGGVTTPTNRQWGRIVNFGTLNLANTQVRYGGYIAGGLSLRSGSVTSLTSATIHDMGSDGISLSGGTLTATGSTISNNGKGLDQSGGSATFTSSTFSNNTQGFEVQGASTSLNLTNNIFTNHTVLGSLMSFGTFNHSGNTASGGSVDGFLIGGAISNTRTLHESDLPYIVNGPLTIQSGGELIIEAGATLKFRDTSSGLEILAGGTLTGDGTISKPITFTALTGTTDRLWGRILNRGIFDVSHATISHGGFTAGGLTTTAGSFTTLDHVTLSQMGSDGISSAGVTTITNTTVTGNSKGIEVTGGTFSINYSAIYGNNSGLENGTSTLVDATYNWWGSANGPLHTSNPSGAGNSVSGNVDFTPFFISQNELDVVKTYKVAVILAETYDVRRYFSSSLTTQPCKLIPEKTYPHGHDKSFYKDFYSCVTDYYREVSKGTVNLQFEIFDNGGGWYRTLNSQYTDNFASQSPQKLTLFQQDIINIASPDIDYSAYDIFIIKHSAPSVIRSQVQYPRSQLFRDQNKYIATTSEFEGFGVDAHELGHILGSKLNSGGALFPDLYEMGMSVEDTISILGDHTNGKWDLMAEGYLNEAQANPPHPSSFTQEFLGLLEYDTFSKSSYPTQWVTPLSQLSFGSPVFRYNLSESSSVDFSNYYIIEKRDKTLGVWDSSVPTGSESSKIVLYYVQPGLHNSLFGNDGWANPITKFKARLEYNTITTPMGAVLSTNQGVYRDWDNLVSFSVVGNRNVNGLQQTQVKVSELTEEVSGEHMKGFVLRTNSDFKNTAQNETFGEIGRPSASELLPILISDAAFFFRWELFVTMLTLIGLFISIEIILYLVKKGNRKYTNKHQKKIRIAFFAFLVLYIVSLIGAHHYSGWRQCTSYNSECFKNSFYASTGDGKNADLDLHAITPDGRHIGVNYQTGEYENQIAGSIVSGDNQGIHEWIFVPEGETVRYYVSARDNQAFLAENSNLTNKTDTFDIYSRTIDPAIGISTSEVLTNQAIEPTEQRTFELSGTSENPSVTATRALTVTADNQRIPLGAEIPLLSYTLSGFEESDTTESSTTGSIACTTTATNTSPVGTYPITCTRGDFASEDYAIASYTSGTLTIAPTLTVTGDDLTIPEGSDIPTLTATIGGFLGTDTAESTTTGTPDCVTTATNTSPIGTYPITCTVGTLSSSTYIITTYTEGVLTILPRLTVTADDKTMTEGQAVPPLTTTITGFLGSDTKESSTDGTPACSTTAGPSSAPGAYPIVCTVGTLESNTYALTTFVDGTLTVEPAIIIRPLTVTAHDKTMVQGKPLPALTYTLSGFMNSDTAASSTTGSASCTTTATTTSPVGIYPITCTEGSLASATYTFSDFVPATLTITDGTPPELQTVFSMTLKDVVLSAVDSVDEQPTFAHTGNTITLTDAAGNITTINLTKYKESATKLKLTFNSITRNGVTTSVPNTTIMYDWSLSANNQLKDLDSRVTIHGVERYIFNYKRLKDETKIKVKTGNSHTTTTRDGFVSPTVTTEGGGVLVTY